ncbi:MAG: ComEC/Rec2 family competence protein [bacterium]
MNAKKQTRLSIFYLPLAGLILGIYAQAIFCIQARILIITIISLIIIALLIHTQKLATQVILALLFATTGALTLELQKTDFENLHKKYENKTLSLIGTITNKEYADSAFYQEILTISVKKIHPQEKFHVPLLPEAHITNHKNYYLQKFNIQLYVQLKTQMLPADTIEITNVPIKTEIQENLSGNPAFSDYLFKEKIFTTVFTANKNIEIKQLYRPRLSLSRWFWNTRNNLYTRIKNKLSRTSSYYFSLIFLGNKQLPQHENNGIRKTFNYWGLAHYLARAGLHISLFVIIWRYFLRLIPIHLVLKRILLLLMCVLYSMFSWPSIPFSRAYFTFLLLQVGALLYRQTSFLHILSLLALVILLVNPMQLFFLDFQLSFGLTLAIAWVATL